MIFQECKKKYKLSGGVQIGAMVVAHEAEDLPLVERVTILADALMSMATVH